MEFKIDPSLINEFPDGFLDRIISAMEKVVEKFPMPIGILTQEQIETLWNVGLHCAIIGSAVTFEYMEEKELKGE